MSVPRMRTFGSFRPTDLPNRSRVNVDVPLLDRCFDGKVTVIGDSSGPHSAVLRLENVTLHASGVGATDGHLFCEKKKTSLGVFGSLYSPDHLAELLRELLLHHELSAAQLYLEVAKRVGSIKPSQSANKWRIHPEIPSTGLLLDKYLLMKDSDGFIFGWTNGENQHRDIWANHPGSEILGGGFVTTSKKRGLLLSGESLTFHQPPIELVHDAALGMLGSMSDRVDITSINIEGAQRYQLIN